MTSNELLPSLPTDIQYIIYSHLTFHECLRCSTVCKSWRSPILTWPGMWKKLSTSDDHIASDELFPYRKYIHGPDVEYLFASDLRFPRKNLASEVIDFVVERKCEKIKHVELRMKLIDSASFLKLASVCGNSLTRVIFTIYMPKAHNITTPDQILLHCPNLKKLYFEYPGKMIPTWISSLADFQHQNLIDLALLIYPSRRHYGGVDPAPFLRSAPNLQRLSLRPYDIDNDIPLIQSSLRQYCPSLSSLYLCDEESIIRNAADVDWKVQQTFGLRELVFQDYAARYEYISFLRRNFEESHEYLTMLDLGRPDEYIEDTFEVITEFMFPCLNHLALDCYACTLHPNRLLAFLARSVPNLRSLKLSIKQRVHGEEDDGLPQTTALDMKHLERVELSMNNYFTNQLENFFDLMTGSALRTIIFTRNQALTERTLGIIATNYPVLDELVIGRCHNISIQGFKKFFDRWSPDGYISKLRIVPFVRRKRFPATPSTISQDDILELLASMDKVAKKWTFHTIFPEDWDAFPYKQSYRRAVLDSVSDVEYRMYICKAKSCCSGI